MAAPCGSELPANSPLKIPKMEVLSPASPGDLSDGNPSLSDPSTPRGASPLGPGSAAGSGAAASGGLGLGLGGRSAASSSVSFSPGGGSGRGCGGRCRRLPGHVVDAGRDERAHRCVGQRAAGGGAVPAAGGSRHGIRQQGPWAGHVRARVPGPGRAGLRADPVPMPGAHQGNI
ncbi:rCG58850, isoform CRA_a [Rattus norvegicus]|uniref:RCG58850, isoform CRA_a n=1 Tax=Rattus norvegicus TaxID=10116 RepID=A6KRL1_RAT|nr:rCG58850, isoform CRA_a [Rattus norvegicus]